MAKVKKRRQRIMRQKAFFRAEFFATSLHSTFSDYIQLYYNSERVHN